MFSMISLWRRRGGRWGGRGGGALCRPQTRGCIVDCVGGLYYKVFKPLKELSTCFWTFLSSAKSPKSLHTQGTVSSSPASVVPSSVDVRGRPCHGWPAARPIFLTLLTILAAASWVMRSPCFPLASIAILQQRPAPSPNMIYTNTLLSFQRSSSKLSKKERYIN